MPARVRAPELARARWLGTGGTAYALADFRGRFALLYFWTFCWINCLHVLDEMREIEEKYGDVLVVVGVHSPKFAHEADPVALEQAVERYDVRHPVLDDASLTTWQAYAVRAWPTLVLVDPEGYVVAQFAGEGHAHALARVLDEEVARHEAKGTLRRGAGPWVPPAVPATELRFPGKLVALPNRLGGGFLVSDTARHAVVRLDPDLAVAVRFEGGLREPHGLCVLPEEVALDVGYDVVVADTGHHQLRGLRLSDGSLRLVAGSGRAWMQGVAAPDDLSSPWDLAWWDDRVWVAMAGIHQLWTFDPRTGALDVVAGTTNEGLVDGPAREAWMAQPSGLAAGHDALWVADSETSSLRRVVRPDGGYAVETVVGQGLFDFGHVDGPATAALLQHPLGVAVAPDGAVLVADTYNGAVRRYDPVTDEVTTVATGLAEPSDVLVDAADPGTALVVESAAHAVRRVPLLQSAVPESRSRTHRPPTELAPGRVRLEVAFTPPPGQHLDERYGPATRLVVSSTPEALLRSGAGRGTDLVPELDLDPAVGDGVLHVAAMAASCDDVPSGAGHDDGDGPACHVHQQDWGVPVTIAAGAPAELRLPLLCAP